MLDWLAANATLVQAISSIVSVMVTVALAVITYEYVRLTQRMAESSDAQLMILRASVSAKINALAGYVKTLRILVDELPDTLADADRLRTAATWTSDNLAEFQRLASEHSRRAGERAAIVVPSLRWVRDRVDTVKAAKPGESVAWDAFLSDQWTSHKQRASLELEAIWDGLPSDDELEFRKRRTDKKRQTDSRT